MLRCTRQLAGTVPILLLKRRVHCRCDLALPCGGGFVGVIGFTGDYGAGGWIFASALLRCCECAGARVQAMNRAIMQHGFRPAIEQTFPLEKQRDAFALMERGGHFGKIAITPK
jgi:Zinc-binding dehydrogenase